MNASGKGRAKSPRRPALFGPLNVERWKSDVERFSSALCVSPAVRLPGKRSTPNAQLSTCNRHAVTRPQYKGLMPQAGFTLMELMVVLMLLAIVTALILPELTGTHEDALLRSTSRKIIDVCNLANSRAISTSRPQRVQLDGGRGRYRLETISNNRPAEAELEPRPRPDAVEGTLDPRITIELRAGVEPADHGAHLPPNVEKQPGPSQTISFYPDGTADRCDIVLRDRTGVQLALRINPITARITLNDPVRP